MAIKIYGSGNMVYHESTSDDLKDDNKVFIEAGRQYYWPKDRFFYSYDSDSNEYSLSRFNGVREFNICNQLVYSDFLKSDDTDFVSNNELQEYLDLLLGANDNPDINGPNFDAFARSRVSNPVTLFDSKQIFDNQPLFWDDQETSGSGTSSTYSNNNARTRLAVSASTEGVRTRQTFMRFNYQPGKSQLVILTTRLESASDSGISGRVGLFDDDNGLFFAAEDQTLKVVRRSSTSGSAVDTKVSQSDWNIDTMDGNGPSRIALDLTKTQILFIDFEWLGVGRVRFGFFVGGIPYYCHEMLHANVLEQVYMSTPNLPIRYEIENEGTGGAVSMDQICSTVISEGGNQDLGALHVHDNGTTAITVGTTKEVLLAIQLKTTSLAQVVNLVKLSVAQTTADNSKWELHFNPTLSAGLSYTDHPNSNLQSAVGTGQTVSSDGYIIDSDYLIGTTQNRAATQIDLENAIRLGATIAGVRDQVVLVAETFSGTADLLGSLQWRELV